MLDDRLSKIYVRHLRFFCKSCFSLLHDLLFLRSTARRIRRSEMRQVLRYERESGGRGGGDAATGRVECVRDLEAVKKALYYVLT